MNTHFWVDHKGEPVKPRKIVTMMTEKPKSLTIFEENIIIDYDHSVIEVKDNVGEFLFLGKKNAISNQYTQHN